MSTNGIDIRELKAIVEWASLTADVRELSVKVGDTELFISKNEHARQGGAAPVAQAPVAVAAPAAAPVAAPAPAAAAAPVATPVAAPAQQGAGELVLAPGEVVVKAPMVGTYYASPQPGAASFVSVGDTVTPETVTCIVEVMKLMNNVEAGVAGTVTQILVENEAAVQYGQPLLVIRQA